MIKVSKSNQNKDKYFWLPVGDENLASSRLRCYYLHNEFLKLGILSYKGNFKIVNTYIIQKRFDIKALFIIALAKIFNAKVILDIDDVKPEDKDWERRILLFGNLVDAITTATDNQLIFVKKCLTEIQKNITTFYCFENPIDYNISTINYKRSISNKKTLNIGWFGNAGNFNLHREFKLLNEKGYNLVIIADYNPYPNSEICNLKFIKWNRNEFHIQLLNNIDICLLSHFGDKLTESKSANKLIASIAIGVPVIASSTPAYTKIARKFGIANYLYTTEDTIIENIKKLSDVNSRINYLKCRNLNEFNDYTSKSIALKYLKFANLVKKKNENSLIFLSKAFFYLLKMRIVK
jgi:hypothetical protein